MRRPAHTETVTSASSILPALSGVPVRQLFDLIHGPLRNDETCSRQAALSRDCSASLRARRHRWPRGTQRTHPAVNYVLRRMITEFPVSLIAQSKNLVAGCLHPLVRPSPPRPDGPLNDGDAQVWHRPNGLYPLTPIF